MDAAMDEKCSRLDLVFAGHPSSFGIDDDEVLGSEFAPVKSLRIDEELARSAGHREREMVANALAEPEVRGSTQGARKLLFCFGKVGGRHARIMAPSRR